MRALNLLILVLALFSMGPIAKAGVRAEHWSGFDLGSGAPFPSLVGAALGFNTGDEARVSIGYGIFGPWSVYQADAKFFFSDQEWSFYIGGGLDYMNGAQGKFLIWNLEFDRGFVPYFELGVDFQSQMGIHVGFNLGTAAPNGTLILLPGILIGWYF